MTYFRLAALEEKSAERRTLYNLLAEMAQVIQEDVKLLEALKTEIEEIRHSPSSR